MARNYRVGPIWMPGTVVGRNGPLSYLIKVNGGQLWRCHINQLREQEDTPREHPSQDQQPQITQNDATVWLNPRSSPRDSNQSDSTELMPEGTIPEMPMPDTQQHDISDQSLTTETSTAAPTSQTNTTQQRCYPLRKRTPNKKYV